MAQLRAPRSVPAVVTACLGLVLVACGGGEDGGAGDPEARDASGAAAADSQGRAQLPDDQLGSLDRSDLRLVVPWTVGQVNRNPSSGAGRATVSSVELSTLPGADRILITFEAGSPVPGYRVAGTVEPLQACATGDSIQVAGEGLLQIVLNDAESADGMEEPPSPVGSGLANVRTLQLACDRDGRVEWVLSVRRATLYRAVETANPPRLAVDVKHDVEEEDGG